MPVEYKYYVRKKKTTVTTLEIRRSGRPLNLDYVEKDAEVYADSTVSVVEEIIEPYRVMTELEAQLLNARKVD